MCWISHRQGPLAVEIVIVIVQWQDFTLVLVNVFSRIKLHFRNYFFFGLLYNGKNKSFDKFSFILCNGIYSY